MKPKQVVLLYEGDAHLFLTGVVYDEEFNIKTGYVENGCWNFEVKNGECLAKEGQWIRNRWPMKPYEIIDVTGVKGDYNAVCHWAEQRSNYKGN